MMKNKSSNKLKFGRRQDQDTNEYKNGSRPLDNLSNKLKTTTQSLPFSTESMVSMYFIDLFQIEYGKFEF